MEKKHLVIRVAANPFDVTLARELRNVNKMELVYFKLINYDTASVPLNLNIKVDGLSGLGAGLMVPSMSVTPSTTGAVIRSLDSGYFPLHTKLGATYMNGITELTYPILHGKQIKGMRWSASKLSNVTQMKITIADDAGTPLVLPANSRLELVFEVAWSDVVNQSQLFRTDHNYMNAMNS